MKRVVPVDSGKFTTKALTKDASGEIKRVSFRTKMDETQEVSTAAEESYVIRYNNKSHLVGQEAETVDFDKSKAKEIHRIATFTAVGLLVEGNKDEVTLVIGCPVDIFNDVPSREAYRQYFLEDRKPKLEINGEEKTFILSDVIVCPESSGIILKNTNLYEDRLVAIVDIGGLNTNGLIYDRMNPIKSTGFTLNEGANILSANIKHALNSQLGTNLQDWQMEHVIKNGYVKVDPEKSREIISRELQRHINQIVLEAKKKNWDISTIDFIFIGGGSLLLDHEIRKAISDVIISKNAIWDNVEGFGVAGGL